MGDTAKQLSERFGKIMQERESLSINSQDTSITRSKQLEAAIPPSRIASLSSGEFVGALADDPTEKIELKTFHCEILNDHDALKAEEEAYVPIPKVREISQSEIEENYIRIKQEVVAIMTRKWSGSTIRLSLRTCWWSGMNDLLATSALWRDVVSIANFDLFQKLN